MAEEEETLRELREGLASKRRSAEIVADDGGRCRLTLRVTAELSDGLEVIRMASGVNKNAFCEDVLLRAVRAQLKALSEELDEGEVDVLLKLARRGRTLSGSSRRRRGGRVGKSRSGGDISST